MLNPAARLAWSCGPFQNHKVLEGVETPEQNPAFKAGSLPVPALHPMSLAEVTPIHLNCESGACSSPAATYARPRRRDP
jgi:hypothetical protein